MRERLLRNTALLTVSSLLMSLIGLGLQSWLAGRIGAEGLGLTQLVGSVAALGATFAISGVRFAATRLVAEELGAGNGPGVRAAMGRCLGYAAFFGLAAGLILYLSAAPLAGGWIGDARSLPSLRLAAFGLPCISLCAAMSGYFTACGRLWRPTLVHLTEQLVGAAGAAFFLRRCPMGNAEAACAAVTAGRLLGDLASVLLMAGALRADLRRHFPLRAAGRGLTGRLLKLALPLAGSAYARSGLNTAQQLLIPRGLRACGQSPERALAGYGTVHGMALPLLLFPSCVLGAAAELIVPELTRLQVGGEKARIRRAVRAFLGRSLLYAGVVGLVLFLLAEPLARLLFHSGEAGAYIRRLAPLVPVMYLDMSVDGCLKGLGQQLWSMGVNAAESLTGLLLVALLLPRWGLAGYLAVIWATETLNFLLSAGRLVTLLRRDGSARGGAASSRRCGAAGAKCACRADRSAATPARP